MFIPDGWVTMKINAVEILLAKDWEKLFDTIQNSCSISRHVEFFRWLQDEVHSFLPHDVLVAVWGDFDNGRLNYDVASNIPEINTQHIANGCVVDPLMVGLYRRWLSGGEQWFVLTDFDLVGMNASVTNHCVATLEKMKGLMVHGVRDRRSNRDCLYVFFSRKEHVFVNEASMQLLLPHIDSALRRVECLMPVPVTDAAILGKVLPCNISDREHEIMMWVTHGKTNYEIGMILNISPNTVKNHLKRIFQKLGVYSRAQAVAKYEVTKHAA